MLDKKANKLIFVIVPLVFVIGLGIRFSGFGINTSDLECFYSWYRQLAGGDPSIKGLMSYYGDYPMTYIFLMWIMTKIPVDFAILIRLLSIAFDVLLASFAGLIASEYRLDKKVIGFAWGFSLVWLWPTIIMNSSFWAQCDSIYVSFLVITIYCLIKEKHTLAFVFLGLAFSFKLQSIFIVPFIGIYYWIMKKFSAINVLIIPVIMFIMNIPAMMAGYSPSIAFSIFMGETNGYPWMYYFYPNFWYFFQARPYYMFKTSATILTFVVLLTFMLLLVYKKEKISKERIIPFVVWTAYTCVMFLPSMHERYGYFADVTAIICAVNNKKYRLLPLGMLICILPKYLWAFDVLGNLSWIQALSAVGNIAVYVVFTIILYRDTFAKEKVNA